MKYNYWGLYTLLLLLLVLQASASDEPLTNNFPTSLEVITTENVSDLELLTTLKADALPLNFVTDMAFDANSAILAYSTWEEVILWDINAQEIQWRLPLNRATAVAFSPDGRSFAAGANFNLYLWNDLSDETSWQKLVWVENQSAGGAIGDIRFNEDGTEVVAVITPSYGIYRWQVYSGELLLENYEFATDENSMVTRTLLSSDAQSAAMFRRRPGLYVDFVNTSNGELTMGIPIGNFFMDSTEGIVSSELLTFTQDNQNIFVNVSSPGRLPNSILVNLSSNGELIQQIEYGYEVFWSAGVFTPNGTLLILVNSADQGIYFFDPTGMEQIAILPSGDTGLRTLAICPDGTLLASGGSDGTVRLWGIPAGA